MKNRTKAWALAVGLLVTVLLVVMVSACGSRVREVARQLGLDGAPSPTPTATATATPSPTPTPTPTLLVPDQPSPSAQGSPLALPSEPNMPFQAELTQDQVNEYVAGQTYDLQGLTVSNIHVNITDQALIADFDAEETQTGMTLPLTVRGVPVVSDGDLYFRVESFEIGGSVSGLTRAIARGLVQRALDDYSTENGIPVPINNMQFESVELEANRLIVTGRTQ
jgi:hypothetical protein